MEFVKLIPINRICPCCGNGNYMRIISGKYVGELNVKCINCNSYYNYDELLKRNNSKPLDGADGRTMDDLISRAAAIEAALDGADEWDGGYNPERERYIREHMAKVPSIDAVLVVMCRDCKYWEMPRTAYGIKCGYCNNMHSHVSSHRMPEENYYCPHGERRESE